jgi:uncharacterized protein with NAD-binding domain and iron-sulfur cluster
MTEQGWPRRKADRRRVVVVGAGVAGMTAAHELIERGYEVEVVEAACDPCKRDAPRIGGMARTSWARVPRADDAAPAGSRAGVRIAEDHAGLPVIASLGDLIDGKPSTRQALDAFKQQLRDGDRVLIIASRPLGDNEPGLRALFAEESSGDPPTERFPVTIEIAENVDGEQDDGGDPLDDDGEDADDAPSYTGNDPELQRFARQVAAGRRDRAARRRERTAEQAARAARQRIRVQISVAGARVPGEHGFRFFPSFYHHLFDTMKRIPIAEAAIPDSAPSLLGNVAFTRDSARSVFDALRSADVIQIGLVPGSRTFEIPRRPMRSLEDVRALFGDVLDRAGYRSQDLHRLITRYLEYLMSSPERRRGYEDITWATFLGLDDGGYSSAFQAHVNCGSQALVAMSSETNDARTIGSIAMQLTLDQLRANSGGYTDATLRGPTSIELFEPWRAFLESESVVFSRAELVGFSGIGMATRPVFARTTEYGLEPADIAPADHYVITVPVDRFQALFSDGQPAAAWVDPSCAPVLLTREQLCNANRLCLELDRLERGDADDPPGETSDDIAKLLEFPLGNVAASPDAGPLRYMCGIQFYFESDIKMIVGHTLCLDSPWGVSHISQAQYWQDRSRGQSGVRGVISAIFTVFQVKASDREGRDPRTALECTPDEVAERVWKQIADAWDAERFGKLEDPSYYYLDESLQRDGAGWHNATPYLVNRVGDWPRRGGLRVGGCDEYAYRMQLGHTVFAGAFMRTFTRLNTMEAANESGRRAANAIVAYDGASVQAARLWNPDDHELPELSTLRELDRRILRRGGGHVLRNTGVEAALRAVPWDLVRLFLPTRGDSGGDR